MNHSDLNRLGRLEDAQSAEEAVANEARDNVVASEEFIALSLSLVDGDITSADFSMRLGSMIDHEIETLCREQREDRRGA